MSEPVVIEEWPGLYQPVDQPDVLRRVDELKDATPKPEAETVTCPACMGRPQQEALICGRGPSGSFSRVTTVTCQMCQGAAVVSPEAAARYTEARRLRGERVALHVGPREEAARLGITPQELSRRERGY